MSTKTHGWQSGGSVLRTTQSQLPLEGLFSLFHSLLGREPLSSDDDGTTATLISAATMTEIRAERLGTGIFLATSEANMPVQRSEEHQNF